MPARVRGLPAVKPPTSHTPQEDDSTAQRLLEVMSVQERVGQLFLVTFQGDRINNDVTDLILEYHVGGVVFLANNDNITGYGEPANAPTQIAELTNNLQQLAISGPPTAESEVEDDTLAPDLTVPTPVFTTTKTPIPLFIGINHEGDGYPNTHILEGVTAIPNNLAIGATWQPAFAETVGNVVGQELSAMGINMLLGPSLDVLENPVPFSPSDLGVRTFGGDPYWVGLMGHAYTTGVHNGSDNRVAVIPKHFPGYGASDRPLHEEIPTVQKSLDQLAQIELAPFFAVTGNAANTAAAADGLLATHIRYQGFQGNIRATTNPVSFDPQALAALMMLEAFSGWRQAGGIIVSDSLGVRAVERFYNSAEQGFPHRQIAREAFQAGNDLLYLADFAQGEGNYEQELENIKDTISWFEERYVTDIAFQQQVDAAVLRILNLKLRLYGEDFSLDNVLVDETTLDTVIGQGETAMVDLAQNAVTLIAPSPEELASRLARPPSADDNIVIFTDVREVRQCATCPLQPLISKTAIEERILALYGPEASDQVRSGQINSHSFDELQAFLDAGSGPIIYSTVPVTPTAVPDATATPIGEPTAEPLPFPTATPPPEYLVQESLRNVDWIIFAMLEGGPNSQTLSNFLFQRPDLIRDNRVIVFAYNAPYYLDSTEITQLTAYYAIYSKTEPFIDTSVRALFQELPLSGASPVDIDGIRYDLFHQTQPDPAQVIALSVTNQSVVESPAEEATPLTVSVSDLLSLQTGVIIDRNGHPVPDGTIVRFIQLDRVDGSVNIIGEVPTGNGIAQLDYVLQSRTEGGRLRIRVEAGEALISQEVDITVESTEEGGALITIFDPTPPPTNTPIPVPPTATVTATSEPTRTPTPIPTLPATPPQPPEPGVRIELSEFEMLTAVFAGLVISGGLALSISRRVNAGLKHQIGWPLWSIAGGLLAYIYFALELPGTEMFTTWGSWAGLITTIVGGVSGLVIYQIRRLLGPH